MFVNLLHHGGEWAFLMYRKWRKYVTSIRPISSIPNVMRWGQCFLSFDTTFSFYNFIYFIASLIIRYMPKVPQRSGGVRINSIRRYHVFHVDSHCSYYYYWSDNVCISSLFAFVDGYHVGTCLPFSWRCRRLQHYLHSKHYSKHWRFGPSSEQYGLEESNITLNHLISVISTLDLYSKQPLYLPNHNPMLYFM